MPAYRFTVPTAPLLAAALVAGLAPSAAAQAAPAGVAGPAEGRYYLQNAVTGLNVAASQDTVAQHRPRGDEDHQQWWVRSADGGYLLENADLPGRCLGRSGAVASLVACAAPEARWQVFALDAGRFAVKDPVADRYLTITSGSDRLAVGDAGDAGRWFLTPLTLPGSPLPAPADRRLDQVTFLTAHNAFANGKDGGFAPPFINLFPNQNRGVERQLADGVRGLMFDIHQTRDGAILCHQSCTLVSRPVALAVDLQRIVDFLRRSPGQFVTVFLEDYTDAAVLRAELAKVSGLADVLYRPDQEGVREHGWPRMGELAQRGKGLLIFTDRSRAQDASAGPTRDSFGVLYQREWTVENHWSMGSGASSSDWSCYSRWGTDIPLTRTEPGFQRLFVMNHFRDTPVSATIATDNSKLLDRTRRFCEPAARKKPTFLAVDRYDLGNPMATVDQLNTYHYAAG